MSQPRLAGPASCAIAQANPLAGSAAAGGVFLSSRTGKPAMSVTNPSDITSANRAFFETGVGESDPELSEAIHNELGRQRDEIELIASENIVSRAVLEAQGSVLTNKYAEGYPGRRYYGGCQFVDVAENLAIDRARNCSAAISPTCSRIPASQANQAVFMALCQAGRHGPGAQPRSRRASDARVAGQSVRQVVQRGALRRAPRRPSDRHGRGRTAGCRAQAGDASSPAARPIPRIIDFARFREIADRSAPI